jgi:hypothetical protein
MEAFLLPLALERHFGFRAGPDSIDLEPSRALPRLLGGTLKDAREEG